MYPDGRLERFDEIALCPNHPALADLYDPATGGVRAQRLAGRASLTDFYNFVEETLRTYQSYWIPEGLGDDWRGSMPYAFFLQEGMKLTDVDTLAEYTIEEVVRDGAAKPTGEVRLTGGDSPPTGSSLLELAPADRISFSRISPRNQASVDFEEDATRKDTPTPFRAYVDFVVVEESEAESEPGSSRPVMLGRKKMYREMRDDIDPNRVLEVRGQLRDAKVRFYLWGATEEQAEDLVQWFYDYMDLNSWIFRFNGIPIVHFLRRGMDLPVIKWRSAMYQRSVDYFVRTERLFTAQYRKLDHITAYVTQRASQGLRSLQTPTTGRPEYRGAAVPITMRTDEA